MSQFETFTYEQLDEIANPADYVAADYVARVAAYDLAGVVLRGTFMQHERGQRPAIAGLANLAALGACQTPDTFVVGKAKDSDFGFHRDAIPNDATPKCRPIALHNSVKGSSAEVKLVKAWPGVDNKTLARLGINKPATAELRAHLMDGQVDTELFEPICYTTTVRPSDTLAFIDYRTFHDFRTVNINGEGRTFSVAYYPFATTPAQTTA